MKAACWIPADGDYVSAASEKQTMSFGEQAIFDLVRAAFLAGWRAAEGKKFQILPAGKQ